MANQNKKVKFVALNAISVGIAYTYSCTPVEERKNDRLNPDDDEFSWISSCLPFGAIIGAAIAGYLSNKIGRKDVLVYLSLFLVGGWLTIAYATSLTFLYIGRFITGMCIGIICVFVPMYIVEISTPEKRGQMGINFQVCLSIGMGLSQVHGYFCAWDWVAISGVVVAIVALLSLLPFPESPRWLLMNNKQADAIHSVNFLYGNTNDPSVNELLNESLTVSTRSSLTMTEIWHPTFYKPAMLSIALMFFQQFSGSYAILYYCDSVLKLAWPGFSASLSSIMMCVTTLLSSWSKTDIIGRKIFLCISGFVTFISLNAMSVYLLLSAREPDLKETYGSIPLVCLLVYIAGFSVGLGPIPWLMMSEMSSIRVRGLVCGLGTAFSWIFVFIITKTFLKIVDAVGDYGAYWIYSVFCLFTCFFTLIFLPETKGKTLEEIENYFAGGEPQTRPLPDPSVERFTDQGS